MEIVVKKTFEILDQDISKICVLYNEIFKKNIDLNVFKEEFSNNPRGYSYHAILYDMDRVIGHNAYIPFLYRKGGEPFWLTLSIDAMVHPDYRGKGCYKQLLVACGEAARADGCKLRVGFPNDNSYPIQKKIPNFNEIGTLSTYCNPVRLNSISKKLFIFNPLTIVSSFLIMCFSYLSVFCKKTYKYKYEKDRETFDKYRYQWFGGGYTIVENKELKFVYKKSDFKGKEAMFLLDVYPMSKSNFDKACRYIYFHEFKNVPILIYVGNLKFVPFSMVRIPKRIEPKHFHFLSKVYDEEFIDKDVLDIDNWNVNLSNYDLL